MFTGLYAMHPVTGERVPIWVANFVLMGYGTGAVMAVPAHDERDWEFATEVRVPIRQVIVSPRCDAIAELQRDVARHADPMEVALGEPRRWMCSSRPKRCAWWRVRAPHRGRRPRHRLRRAGELGRVRRHGLSMQAFDALATKFEPKAAATAVSTSVCATGA
jgi:hypothetical protein